MTTVAPPGPANAPAQPDSTAWFALSTEDALEKQGVDREQGLAAADVKSRLAKYGPNKFTSAKKVTRWQMFLRQFKDPMQIFLVVSGGICLFLPDQLSTGILLLLLTLFNALLGMNQEGKATSAADALSKKLVVTAKTRRDGDLVDVSMDQLVPGDIVNLQAGDLVPADARILDAATLEIDESALTGESVPSPKQTAAVAADAELADRADMAFMNTQVTRGSGVILVVTTGMDTQVGHISGMLSSTVEEETPLTKQINGLTRQILLLAGFALVASLVLGFARGGEFDDLFLAAIALMIAAIPTALPAIDTAILSRGSQMLAKAGAIVKQLRSVETLGSTSALNSDKTGTLTMNQMTAVAMSLAGRRYTITGTGYSTTGVITQAAGQSSVKLEPYLLPMALCSDAEVRDGELTGDPTEGALVVLATKGGIDVDQTREAYPRVATLPFDAAYKLMATFHDWTDGSGKKVVRAYIKGSPNELLKRAASVDGPDGKAVPVAQKHDAYLAERDRMAKQGMRLMGTGVKDFDPATFDPTADLLKAIEGLELLALVGITDPPRPAAQAAIAEGQAAGMQIRMITGDAALTGAVVAKQLGIKGRAITGAEFRAMSDEEARSEVGGIGVIGRVTPEDKVELVDVLREKDNIVAMTGDGVNDAPAIKKADIGIAMGITGTQVTKAAADMILSDDNYATIIKAVSIGRNVYDNLLRFIRFQMAACYAYITVFLGAAIFNILSGTPFQPIQAMWLMLTVNVCEAIGLGFGKPRDGLMKEKPRPKDQKILPPRLNLWLAFVGLWIGAGCLAIMAWADGAFDDMTAQTMGVTAFALFRIVSALETADETRSVFSGYIFDNPMLLKATGLSIVLIVAATELGILQEFLSMEALSGEQWLICIGVALTLVIPEEIRKFFRIKAGHEMPEPTVATPAATATAPTPAPAPANA